MSVTERSYVENVAAQEAAYWYCRENGIRADDLVIGQILQVAGPIILQGAVKALREIAGALDGQNVIGADEAERLRKLADDALNTTGGQ